MDTAGFWAIVDSCRRAPTGIDRHEEQLDALRGELEKLAPEAILEFQREFEAASDRACRGDLWGAAYLINGGCSDDGFVYFRSWLISCGSTVYEAALAAPDSLAGVVGDDEDAEFEDFSWPAREVYIAKTGCEDLDFFARASELSPGREQPEIGDLGWAGDEDESEVDKLAALFPKLAERYGA